MARAVAILMLLAFLTAGCAGDDDTDSDTETSTSTTSGGTTVSASASVSVTGTGAPNNGTVLKTIIDDDFPNGDFTIRRGDTVNWTATGTTHPHSVTSDVPGVFDSSPGCTATTTDPCLDNGQKFSHRFNAAGTFPYHCSVHPTTMTGTITVTS